VSTGTSLDFELAEEFGGEGGVEADSVVPVETTPPPSLEAGVAEVDEVDASVVRRRRLGELKVAELVRDDSVALAHALELGLYVQVGAGDDCFTLEYATHWHAC